MSADTDGVVSFGKRVYTEMQAENVTFMAAGLAYQAFVSLIPLLVLVFFLLSAVGDQTLANRVVDFTQSFLPRQARQLLKQSIAGDATSTGVSVIGAVTLAWGAFKIFKGLDTAFSEIFDTESQDTFTDKLRDGTVVFVALGGALMAAVAATAAFGALHVQFLGFLNPLLLVVGISIAFFPMYYVFPDIELEPTDVLPGVLVGAVGWTALQSLFQVYIALASGGKGTNAIGAILLLLTWLYFSGLVLLLGAVVNSVLLGRVGDAPGDTRGGRRARAGQRSGEAASPEELRAERERLHRERDRLEGARRELRTERRERARDDATGVAALRRENRALRRRVRWYRKPLWLRAAWRALGRDAPDG